MKNKNNFPARKKAFSYFAIFFKAHAAAAYWANAVGAKTYRAVAYYDFAVAAA